MKILYITSLKKIHFDSFIENCKKHNHKMYLIEGKESYKDNTVITFYSIPKVLKFMQKIVKHFYIFNEYCLEQLFVKWCVNKIKPDIIHAIGIHKWGWLAINAAGDIPVIVTCQGSDVFRYPFQDKQVFKRVQKTLLQASIIHTLSSGKIVDHIESEFNIRRDKIKSCYWGINISKIVESVVEEDISSIKKRYLIKEDEIIIFAPRGMRQDFKPIINLADTAERLLKHNVKSKFIVSLWGTDHELRGRFVRLINKMGIQDYFIFLEDFIDHKEMIKLLKISDISLSLAENDGTAAVILESMLIGSIPIISRTETYVTRFKDGKHLYYVDNYEKDQLYNVVDFVIKNIKEIKRKMVINNINLINKQYDRKKNIEKINEYYSQLI